MGVKYQDVGEVQHSGSISVGNNLFVDIHPVATTQVLRLGTDLIFRRFDT